MPKTSNRQTTNVIDFAQQSIAFLLILCTLSLYQHSWLFFNNLTYSLINKSFGINLINQFGFTAIISFALVFIFSYFEGKKANLGKKITLVLFFGLIYGEIILTQYYLSYITGIFL